MRTCRILAWAVVLIALAGCRGAPVGPVDTGSRETVLGFGDAVVRREWARAYESLDAECRKRWTVEQFAHLAESYRRGLGFEPEKMRIRSCEEQGTNAIAHVTFTGPLRRHQYKEGLVLRRAGERWLIVLPRTFGRK